MAEKNKRKSIYDKPLKDINKDGKVNFGDTWLGDALGFDGKVGIQKGRPGLKASLKGARRGEEKSDDTSTSTKPPTRPRARPAKEEPLKYGPSTRPSRRRPKMEGSEVGDKSKGPGATRKSAGPSVQTTAQQPKPSTTTTTTGPAVTRIEETSPNRQTPNKPPMTTADARAKVIKDKAAARANTPTEAQIQAWIKKQGASFHRANKTQQAKRAAAIKALTKTGMAAGGMTSNMGRYSRTGNTNYKGKGMFYDSKSPRGYK